MLSLVTDRGLVLPPVGATAVGVAAIRAAETARSARLFTDPLAASFVRAAGFGGVQKVGGTRGPRASLVAWVTVRTRFLDDLVLDACKRGCRQVVILGAGLDARAFRLDWPADVRLWELDLPDVLKFKEEVVAAQGLRPSCERITVPGDLAEDWSRLLVQAGLDPHAPVVWLAEGVLAYLSAEVSDSLVAHAAELSVPGSRMGLTLASPERLRAWRDAHPDGKSDPRDYVALWRSTAPDKATEWLAAHGWQAEIFDVAERSATYGRPIEEPARPANGARLVDATRT